MDKKFLQKIKFTALVAVLALSLQACSNKEESLVLEYKTDVNKLNEKVDQMSQKIDELNRKTDELNAKADQQKEELANYNTIVVGKLDEEKNPELTIKPKNEGFYNGKYFAAGGTDEVADIVKKNIEVYEIKENEDKKSKTLVTREGQPLAFEFWGTKEENPLVKEGLSLVDSEGNKVEIKDIADFKAIKDKKIYYKNSDGKTLKYKYTLVEGLDGEIKFTDVFTNSGGEELKFSYKAPDHFHK